MAKAGSRDTQTAPLSDASYLLQRFAVIRTLRLSPSFLRVTFGGEAVADTAMWGPDQRVKLYVPTNANYCPSLPIQNWNMAWQQLAEGDRPARRSYTIKALRHDKGEMDIDFVLHGDEGPASAWASRVQVGDVIEIAAPNRHFIGRRVGFEWAPPDNVEHVLLYGDETALPAISNILGVLMDANTSSSVSTFVSVPSMEDGLAATPVAHQIRWLARDKPGTKRADLLKALQANDIPKLSPLRHLALVHRAPDANERIWAPERAEAGDTYVWAAAEAGLVKASREALQTKAGLDKRQSSLMGYWYEGRPFG